MATQPVVKPKSVYIQFVAGIDQNTANALMGLINQKLKENVRRFVLLISSGGGSVFHGLTAYNYLVGIPAEVETHNFGSVDSVGVVIYCAGKRRYCVPHARFLLHGVSANFPQCSLEEKQLEERLKGLRIDIENIAGVIAASTNKTEEQITQAMLERTTLNPEQAIQFGLVHEIRTQLFEPGAELLSILQQS